MPGGAHPRIRKCRQRQHVAAPLAALPAVVCPHPLKALGRARYPPLLSAALSNPPLPTRDSSCARVGAN
jgi:hypothetical protein